MTCIALTLRPGLGPSGFEVRQEPCGGAIRLTVGVTAGALTVTASCSSCAAPEAPWLHVLKTDPQWVLSMALHGWLDEHGADFEAQAF